MNRTPRSRRRALAALVLAGLAAALTAPAGAQAGGPARSLAIAWSAQAGDGPAGETARAQRSSLQLLPGWATENGGRMAGLTIRLDDGWKTYWRVPGDAGIPPIFDWSGSQNVASVEVLWPRPVAFDLFGMTTLGYKHEVTLPLKAVPVDPARPMVLRLSLAYGVCADICMPEMAEVVLPLADAPAQGLAPIEAALAALPATAAEAGARLEGCRLSGEGDDRRLEARLSLPSPPRGPLLAVVEGPAPLRFEPGALTPDGNAMRLTAPLDRASGDAWLDRTALRVTVLGADGAVAFEGCES